LLCANFFPRWHFFTLYSLAYLSCDKDGCETKLASVYQKQQHTCQTHARSISYCASCREQCGTLEIYQWHIANNHFRSGPPFFCHLCQESCWKKTSTSHISDHLALDPMVFICPHCGKTFSSRDRLGRHCTKVCKPFPCGNCSKKFNLKCDLESHAEECNVKSLMCERCSKVFPGRNMNNLKFHLSSVHGIGERFPCRTCGKEFASLPLVSRHEQTHLAVKPLKCSYCPKQFSCKWNKKAHERQHTNEKPYTCDTCGLAFTHNVVRKTHQAKCMQIPQT